VMIVTGDFIYRLLL